MPDAYVTVVRRKDGVASEVRRPLQVPVDLATGDYERLSNRALRDLINDLTSEQLRRFCDDRT